MNAVGVPFIHGRMVSDGMAHGDKVERYYVIRQIQYFLHGQNSFLVRVDTGPHSPETQSMGRKKNIL